MTYLFEPRSFMLTRGTDDGARVTIWVRAELNAGLVAAAIPPLKSLFENVLRNVFGIRSQPRGTASYTTSHTTRKAGTRRSCTRELEDDEIAMRSHAAHLHSGNEFQLHHSDDSIDGGNSAFEDRHDFKGSHERKASSHDQGDYGGGSHHGPITKTMSYTVRRDEPQKGTRGDSSETLQRS